MVRNPVISYRNTPLCIHLPVGTGHNCPSEEQIFRVTIQMNERSFLQGEAVFDMIGEIKWIK
jgi:hypothetical protein